MSTGNKTLGQLSYYPDLVDLVGANPCRRWGKANLVTPRSDGHSIASWFDAYPAEARISLVARAFSDGASWSPLLRVSIPKKMGSGLFRTVDMPVVLDQARIYILADWLRDHAEGALTRVAVAFRRGLQMHQVIRDVQGKLARLPYAAVIDIASFFDSIPWVALDGVIDGLPGEQDVLRLLKDLVRVPVINRRSRLNVTRQKGIPQGLSVSPHLANLVLNEFDRRIALGASRVGARVRRYCDDIIVQAPEQAALQHVQGMIHDRLSQHGLRVKDGTGRMVDTRTSPVHWLGLALKCDHIDVPLETVTTKASDLQDRFDSGILDRQAIKDSLASLYRHYSRILDGNASLQVIRQIRDRLDLSSLPTDTTGKEDIARLRALAGIGHPSRGQEHHREGSLGTPGGTGTKKLTDISLEEGNSAVAGDCP